ncbi:DoxX family membrane protein [Streptomyces griseomycini]|uniref:Membrane protein YphA (DoxX/SURF4 family) n=1 Tax=Streptomyces griseomycini TaxID=66895 RepID=A0A7W7M1E1_9ACTN|nr:DoxX family membrane protein [Streptomyces griseomycini]MBB4900368.1 putative membrane protein YphA (DoxX/SURF4 family) [Streptomyces griseomycini]GGR38923.1 membrane protein [Streptomyces griseomycini]
MSVDTRTPRTPTGDRSSGLDDAPALSMVKVPSDPAQVVVNHASFRVQLGASAWRAPSPRIARHSSAAEDTARIPVVTTMGAAGRAPARRRPVVWSGRSAPDDTGAHRLLQAVRRGGVRHADEPFTGAGGTGTRVVPRPGTGPDGHPGTGPDGHDDGPATQPLETPFVGAQRRPGDGPLLPPMRPVGSTYDEPGYGGPGYGEPAYGEDDFEDTGRRGRRHGDDPARHAYYPGRRMNLGVVLLPLRVLLGSISVYAGMSKLCDPLYFEGGKRGSMVKWLHTLHPWDVAEPLRQFALEHPVGSGLAIAFLQVVVGVLTVLGCWQRVAAVVGALLSAALLVTVSWKSAPAYETPDIIYLAAWSPLIIAGAPVYSVDGRLAGGAWRRLGPRADIWDLRRHVLRRGALVTGVVCGLTLLVGSLLGGAVRDADRVVVPGPGEAPRNELPGSPLPQEPGESPEKRTPSASTPPSRSATSGSTAPSAGTTTPGATQGAGAVTPSQTRGSTGQAPPQQSSPVDQAPSTSSGPTSGGSATGGSSGTPSGGSSSGGGSGSTGERGLVGGLLG